MSKIEKLGDIVRVRRGASPRPIQDFIQSTPGIPWVKIADATAANSRFITKTKEFINQEGGTKSVSVSPGTLIMSNSATPGLPMIMKIDACVHDGWLILDELVGVDRNWLYYYLLNRRSLSAREASGSVFSNLKTDIVKNFKISLPEISAQRDAAQILWDIDEKIELNRKMNETLEQMGQALFRHYFIDNPETEKWEDGVLSDIITNSDSKRKPLSSRQRADMQGEYRYFGATSVMGYVNNYLFDGTYLLLAEDGSVVKADGTPYLQYIWGKFWVNNHAHILQAKVPFTVEYIYLLLSQANVQSLISGAVQLKINQKAMNSFKIKLPPNELVNSFCEKIDPMFAQRRENEEEIQTLTILRDTLLPRLINGKVKV